VGNPFASQTVSDPIPTPWDPAHHVVVRKLTSRELDAAAEAHRSGLAGGSARSWPAKLKRALEHGLSDPQVQQAIQDPLTGYDRYALVRSGLVSWSYPQSVKPVPARAGIKAVGNRPGSEAIVASDAVEDLDDEAVDFIATEVLRLTKPGLFAATAEDADAEKKKD
jgi:hypothetical protein